jgi:hypothetical protein
VIPLPQWFRDRLLVRLDDPGCWEWKTNDPMRYGSVRIGGRQVQAHRFAWAHANGIALPLPRTLIVCHRCDNRPCCRPEHLFSGTVKTNSQDMARKGRSFLGDYQGARKRAAELGFTDHVADRVTHALVCLDAGKHVHVFDAEPLLSRCSVPCGREFALVCARLHVRWRGSMRQWMLASDMAKVLDHLGVSWRL